MKDDTSPYQEAEDMKQERGDYEDRLDPNEEWAEMHGYSRYRCPVHGTFWTDSGDGCPQCGPEPPDDEMVEHFDQAGNTWYETKEQDEARPYHNALPSFHERPEDEVLRGIKAMKTNNDFLIRALRRAGVLAALILALTVPEAVYAMSSCPMHHYASCYFTGQTEYRGNPPTPWQKWNCSCGDSWWEQQ